MILVIQIQNTAKNIIRVLEILNEIPTKVIISTEKPPKNFENMKSRARLELFRKICLAINIY